MHSPPVYVYCSVFWVSVALYNNNIFCIFIILWFNRKMAYLIISFRLELFRAVMMADCGESFSSSFFTLLFLYIYYSICVFSVWEDNLLVGFLTLTLSGEASSNSGDSSNPYGLLTGGIESPPHHGAITGLVIDIRTR